MSNPRINLRLLRQALSSQFESITFRNGERDNFRCPFQELTNSQKHSLISLGNDLAGMELKLRLDNKPKTTQSIMEFDKFAAIRPDLIVRSDYIEECSECDDKCTYVFLEFQMVDNAEVGPRPATFSWQVYCENHLPTPED